MGLGIFCSCLFSYSVSYFNRYAQNIQIYAISFFFFFFQCTLIYGKTTHSLLYAALNKLKLHFVYKELRSDIVRKLLKYNLICLDLITCLFLCHQHLCCVVYRDCFIISFYGVVCRHALYSGQYLKNGLSDLILIWHVDVTAPQGVLYSLVTLNSH